MRHKLLMCATALAFCGLALFLSTYAVAQTPAPAPEPGRRMIMTMPGPEVRSGGPGLTIVRRGEMGAWWKNSETAKQIGLSDAQLKQIEDTFVEHRIRLIDATAEVEKAETRFQALMESDNPSDQQINPVLDKLVTARGNLEREYTGMMLAVRRVLAPEQWKKLRSLEAEHTRRENVFYRTIGPMGPPNGELPPLPPPHQPID